jgi:hypothetical protein
MTDRIPETGSASITVTLSEGVVTIRRSPRPGSLYGGKVLATGAVGTGAWSRIWAAIQLEGVTIEGEE